MQSKQQKIFTLILGIILLWTVFSRVWGVKDRAFWGDEAWVAEAVRDLSWTQLLHKSDVPLPPLFGIIVKAFGQIPGSEELTYRLFPMLCGILTIPFLYGVLRVLHLPRFTALGIIACAASSPPLIIWSRELKQYAAEAFLATFLAWLVFRFRQRIILFTNTFSGLIIVLICLIGPWIGYGFVFPAAALAFYLLCCRIPKNNRTGSYLLGISMLVVLAISSILVLQTIASEQASEKTLNVYYGRWFIRIGELFSWLRAGAYALSSTCFIFIPFIKVIGDPFISAVFGVPLWIMIFYGLIRWLRFSRSAMVGWLLGSWGLVFIAAIAHKYPFGKIRMMLFCAPPTIAACIYGFLYLLRLLAYGVGLPSGLGVWVVLILGFVPIGYLINIPFEQAYCVNYNLPAVLSSYEQKQNTGDAVFVTLSAAPSVHYYRAGNHEGFQYIQVCGTMLAPNVNHQQCMADRVNRGDKRWWIMTTSVPEDHTRDTLFKLAKQSGYQIRLVSEAGSEYAQSGVAQLYLVSR